MIDGKVLVTKESEVDGPLEVWGVWIPRRGDNAIFALEVAVNYGTELIADLYQKNYDEVGNGTDAGVSLTFDEVAGRQTMTKLDAKEVVRVKLTVKRGVSLADKEIGNVLYRFLQPVWFESVKV